MPGKTLMPENISTSPTNQMINKSSFMRPFGEHSIVWRMTSEQAAYTMPDNTLDFCYIDADYSYDGVKKDLNMWLPKVKSGGIICGYDYVKDGNIYNKVDE